jgi:hypothetical protein
VQFSPSSVTASCSIGDFLYVHTITFEVTHLPSMRTQFAYPLHCLCFCLCQCIAAGLATSCMCTLQSPLK